MLLRYFQIKKKRKKKSTILVWYDYKGSTGILSHIIYSENLSSVKVQMLKELKNSMKNLLEENNTSRKNILKPLEKS